MANPNQNVKLAQLKPVPPFDELFLNKLIIECVARILKA